MNRKPVVEMWNDNIDFTLQEVTKRLNRIKDTIPDIMEEWLSDNTFDQLEEKYIKALIKSSYGYGGMNYVVLRSGMTYQQIRLRMKKHNINMKELLKETK